MKAKVNSLSSSAKDLSRSCTAIYVGLCCMLVASPAWAVGGLDGLQSRLQSFTTALIAIGGTLTITGFVWAVAAMILGMAGAARAITVLLGGLAIGLAPQIVGFFTSGL